ncbi:MAG: patatin-like phospholipase family protein [Acidobacteriia bacterium]|nr:patatin-like phospholipase family protein [Terriglobia bacterium]
MSDSASTFGRNIGHALGTISRVFGVRSGQPRGRKGIGLALGGGFARSIAHIGVLQVLEEERIPITSIAGVSAGAIIAAAYASGTPLARIEEMARKMRFNDLARWTLSRMGLVTSERMTSFLNRLLAVDRFETMKIPLAVVATDLARGHPVIFHGQGDVILPIRASCSYPGLFLPVRSNGQHLVDGGMSMDVPSAALRQIGSRYVAAVSLRTPDCALDSGNMLAVVNRCFQILQARTDQEWKKSTDLVIEPEVSEFAWDAFDKAGQLIAAGRLAARAAVETM